MPLGAILGIGMGVSALGGALGQSAANKGPQPLFPSQSAQYGGSASALGQAGTGTLLQMIATGNPTNVGPAYNQLVQAQQPLVQQGQQSLLSSFSAGGLRYSSPAMNAVSQYEQQSNNNFLSILSQYTMQAQESAANRQLSAAQFGVGQLQQAGTMFTSPQGSVAGAALGSAGSDLQTIALLQALGGL